MYAVEFNAQAHNHFIRVPDEIPDGMEMRVLLLMREVVQKTGSKPISSIEAQLLENMTPHLAHADELVNPLNNNQPSQQAMPDTTTTPDLKQLLMSLTDGLTDEDLARPLDMGRSIA